MQASPTVEEIKSLRRQIDFNIEETKRYIQSVGYSRQREFELVYTKLQEAKMWCGKILEEMGHELPKEFRDKS